MQITSPARAARKPAILIAAIVAIVGAIACGDIAPPSAPTSITRVGVPDAAAASGYALASGRSDSTKKN